MTAVQDILATLKKLGGKMGKGFAIECYLQFYGNDFIGMVKKLFDDAGIKPDDIAGFVNGNQALPIPESAFYELVGLEDYLETIDEERIFEWIHQARPDLAMALMAEGDAGAEYVVKFKKFMIGSINEAAKNLAGQQIKPDVKQATKVPEPTKGAAESPEPETEAEPETVPGPSDGMQLKKVTCNDCGESWTTTAEEYERTTECPFCGAPK